MTREPELAACPECRGALERGFVQAPSCGIVWTGDPAARWMPMFSSKVEKLQKDWWGFPKLTKDKLPALRCRRCKLVVFRYTAEERTHAREPSGRT